MAPARFNCNVCSKSYGAKAKLIGHVKTQHSSTLFSCGHCDRVYLSKPELDKHLDDVRRDEKKKCKFCVKEFKSEQTRKAHEIRFHPNGLADDASGENMVCSVCSRSFKRSFWYSHQKSTLHMDGLMREMGGRVRVFESSFSDRCTTYQIKPDDQKEQVDAKLLLLNARSVILPLLESELITRDCMKFRVTLMTVHHRPIDTDLENELNFSEGVKDFNSVYQPVSGGDNVGEMYECAEAQILSSLDEFEAHQSGWSLLRNLFILVNVLTQQLRGSSYLPLPLKLARKNALLNIRNTDDKCFLYCMAYRVYGAHVLKGHRERQESYYPYLKTFETGGMHFPVTMADIGKFETMNKRFNISVNLYSYHDGKFGVLRITKEEKANHVDLLLLESKFNFHYVVITDLSRLISSQLTRHKGAIHHCRRCLSCFQDAERLTLHKNIGCMGTSLLAPKVPFFEFKRYYALNRHRFVAYADLETLNVKIAGASGDPSRPYNRPVQKHQVFAAAYKFVTFNGDAELEKLKMFKGLDSIDEFLRQLVEDVGYITAEYFNKHHAITAMTVEMKRYFDAFEYCFICRERLDRPLGSGKLEKSVYDHDHLLAPDAPPRQNMIFDETMGPYSPFNGNIRGRCHNSCNLKFREKRHVTIVLHSGGSLDFHCLLLAIAKIRNGELTCIARTSESYISFEWKPMLTCGSRAHLRFVDSFRFLPRSLASIIDSMDSFPMFTKYVEENYGAEKFDKSLLGKAPMPYEYIDRMEVLDDVEFPPIEKFFSALRNESVDVENWERARALYERLKCKTLFDYVSFYLASDVIFLAQAGEQFRDIGMRHYRLDPLGYYHTLAGFAFDSCLLFTRKRLPLMNDINHILFSMKALKGGLVYGTKTFATTNSRYSSAGFDPEKGPESHILLCDVVSLYASVMSSAKIPDGDYRWLDEDEMEKLMAEIETLPTDGETGYLIECDMEYDEKLHGTVQHSSWPLLPANQTLKNKGGRKLFSTLYDKKQIVVHHVNLKYSLEKGLKLKKIYRVLAFKQSDWLQAFIKRNIELRATPGLSELYVQILKDISNIIFGKLCEGVEKHTNFRLIVADERNPKLDRKITHLFANPRVKSVAVFDEDFVGVELIKDRVVFNRPIACGVSVLEISKAYMARMVHDVLLGDVGKGVGMGEARVLYSDTDSVYVQYSGTDGYDLVKRRPELFDTSDFADGNRFGIIPRNRKVAGMLAVEKAESVVLAFAYLRPKAYAVLMESIGGETSTVKRCKGVTRAVVKGFTFMDYQRVIENKSVVMAQMFRILSKKHEVYTLEYNKISLKSCCNKRIFMENGDSLPYGHASIADAEYPFEEEE